MLNHVINQVRLEMVMQRVKQETLKSKLLEVMETQKELKAKQEGILKKQDEMAQQLVQVPEQQVQIMSSQNEMKSGISAILEMTQKTHNPYMHTQFYEFYVLSLLNFYVQAL